MIQCSQALQFCYMLEHEELNALIMPERLVPITF